MIGLMPSSNSVPAIVPLNPPSTTPLINGPADRDAVMKLQAHDFLKDVILLKKSLGVLTLVMIAFVLHSFLHLEPSIVALFGACFRSPPT